MVRYVKPSSELWERFPNIGALENVMTFADKVVVAMHSMSHAVLKVRISLLALIATFLGNRAQGGKVFKWGQIADS